MRKQCTHADVHGPECVCLCVCARACSCGVISYANIISAVRARARGRQRVYGAPRGPGASVIMK